MTRKKSIGQAELEVLKLIANSGPTTVRQAADYFSQTKGYVRPTVLKMMERLREKGYLEREVVDGVYAYKSTRPPEELDQLLVDNFVQSSLEGSVTPMVAYLVRNRSMSSEDLDHLRKLIDELDSKENS